MRDVTDIYVLADPLSCKVRYIGITCQELKERLGNHIHDALYSPETNYHKSNWIKKLLSKGQKPVIRRLCTVSSRKEAEELEKVLIARYKDSHNLVNISEGNGEFTSKGQHSASIFNSKRVYVYNYDGTYNREYSSVKDCSIDLKIKYSCIIKCLSGEFKYAKGWQFSYTKVDRMPNLSDYSTGSSVEVILRDNSTGENIRFKSGKHCKEVLGLESSRTNVKDIPALLNKKYGGRYSMYLNGKLIQSSYYNTGICIETKSKTYCFKSKKDLLSYMGYKAKAVPQSSLENYIRKYFTDIISVSFNLPLCSVMNKAN